MNTRESLTGLTIPALFVFVALTILTLVMQILTISSALVTELGERFVQSGEAACVAAHTAGTRPAPAYYATTTRAYTSGSAR